MRASRLVTAVLSASVTLVSAFAAPSLQELIDAAAPGAEVRIPKGTWTRPLAITKPLQLRGDASACILEVTSDSPALRIETKGEVLVEGLTIRWKRETSTRPSEVQAALVAKDSRVTLREVRFAALDDNPRCPSACAATGFSEIKLNNCEFHRFDFTIQFSGGARGAITGCLVANPGHCGITIGPDSRAEITDSIVTGSAFHAIRCTGGELIAKNNLLVGNKNRGFYLGNKAARGEIRDNAIIESGTGISGFGGSAVEIAHNFISKSDFAAIDMRDSCRLKVEQNAMVNNTRGLVLFKESGKNGNSVSTNALAGNKMDMEGFQDAPEMRRVESGHPPDGSFVLEGAAGYGLTKPDEMRALWSRYLEFKQQRK